MKDTFDLDNLRRGFTIVTAPRQTFKMKQSTHYQRPIDKGMIVSLQSEIPSDEERGMPRVVCGVVDEALNLHETHFYSKGYSQCVEKCLKLWRENPLISVADLISKL